MDLSMAEIQSLLWPAFALVGAVLLGFGAHFLIFLAATPLARRTDNIVDDALVRRGKKVLRAILPVAAVFLVLPVLPVNQAVLDLIRRIIALVLIALGGWLTVELMKVFGDVIRAKHPLDDKDNLQARQAHTRVNILNRITIYVCILLTLLLMLMIFPSIRHIGISLFASAGVAGLVVALAARPLLANFIAGIQIALTDAIRLDDVVIVEGEWGWIEEIRITYVVVRIWDLRRLVLPISHFIEKPFQNWTRTTADLLGSVFIYADYSVPVEEVRQELHRILESSEMWDGKVWGLQVTNTTEHAMEMRALMSSPDSSIGWDLRCHVREKLLQFLQERYPDSLPRTRAELKTGPGTLNGVDD